MGVEAKRKRQQTSEPQQPEKAFKRCKSAPLPDFTDYVLGEIRKHGQPEIIPELYRGPIPRHLRYEKIKPISIDRRKRPELDRAPCPMCTPNRFLHGSLIYVPDMECCAVIGHCCAEHSYQADQEFRAKELLRVQEDYLLAAFPHILAKQLKVESLQSAAAEAQRIHRAMRQTVPELMGALRDISMRKGGQLVLSKVIAGKESQADYVGPAGFRPDGLVDQDIDFGTIAGGATATLVRYDPATELTDVGRRLAVFDFQGSEEEAVDIIAGMSAAERRASVANLQAADTSFDKFRRRLQEFVAFLEPANLKRLNAYGTNALNHFPFEVTLGRTNDRPRVVFSQGNRKCPIVVRAALDGVDLRWQRIPFQRAARSQR